MIKKIISIMTMFLFSWGFEPYADKNGKAVLFDFEKDKSSWTVTIKSSNVEDVYFNEKTPDNEAAITYEIQEEGAKSKCGGRKYDGNGAWRQKKYKSLCF